MSKLAIRWLIVGMGISLVGLSVFQVYWVESIISANEEGFNRDVQSALTTVAKKLEKKEVLQVAVDNFHSNFIFKTPADGDSSKLEFIESTFEKRVVEVQDYAKDSATRPEWLSYYFDSEKENSNFKNVSVTKLELPKEPNSILLESSMDSLNALEKEYQTKIKRVAKKSEYIQMAMHELFSGDRPLESRINFTEADSLLKVSLKDYGITLDYDFGIVDPLTNQLTVEKVSDSRSDLLSSQLRASLFPNDVIGEAGYLVIRFPNQKLYLMSKIWITLASSVIFIIIILVCFGFAIRTIFIQKKLSNIKNDFINNMTHEFKTPISTVSLACEALRDEQISSAPGMHKRYLGIINDENKRLGLQVEKVLQMAVIERKDFELKLEEVNLHDIIVKALSNVSLQVSKNGGSISQDLKAINTTIKADRMHLTNIIYNLLDNANKYSGAEPKIVISTIDTAKGIIIKILDEGIGMSKDMVSKIFEKFYRIPTGNRHDVKGFGLGLAYVKNMVEAHGGEIKVKSELHKGSEFTVYLPFEYESI